MEIHIAGRGKEYRDVVNGGRGQPHQKQRLEKTPEGGEGMSHAGRCGIPGRGNSKCKGPEVRV
jgi:hypothetical protein